MARQRSNPDDQVMIAVETGVVNLNGTEHLLRRGVTRARAGHEIVRVFPGFWKPIDVHFDVEQATAAPGEKRGA